MTYTKVFIGLCMLATLALLNGCSRQATEEELLRSATLHQASEEYDEAIADFEELTQKYPKSDKMPEILYALGLIYQNEKKEYSKAESVYTKLATDFPNEPTAQGASYQRARILAWNLHKPDSAIAAYESFLQRYPGIFTASSARQELDSLRKTLKQAK